MTRRTRPRPRGSWFHALVVAIRRWGDAFRHVRSGGRTTRVRAIRRASAPPRRCTQCNQPIPHSRHWEDHLGEHPPSSAPR
jgi:hypothetical protein